MSGPNPLDFPYDGLEQDTLRMASRVLHGHGQEHAALMIDRILARPNNPHYAKPGMAFGHFIDDILRDKTLSPVKKGSAIIDLISDDLGHHMHERQVEAAKAATLRRALGQLVYDIASRINYLRDDQDHGDLQSAGELLDMLPVNLRELLP